ncbi:MAG TPA: alpha/beta fold hydrolase [Steroidobacteraceae bacterium]|nr:alpha/beta fold hydrolase [Steroidobacteraceae bacterium]
MTSATGRSRAKPERTIPGLSPVLRGRLRWLFRLASALSPALAARLAMRLFLTPIARPIEAEEATFLATARSLRLATPLGRLQAYEWPGPAGASAVLLVHGWISHAARMAELILALRARGLRVVAFDAPAHGRSSGTQADLPAFRQAIDAVSAACGPFHGVLAHSFGALTTVAWLSEQAPAELRAVVLVGMMNNVGYVFESFSQAMALNPEVIVCFRARFHARYGGDPESYSTDRLVAQLRVPVLVVHGGIDELVPAGHASEISRQLHDGRLLLVGHLGHSAPLRDPDTVEQIADFLATHLVP